MKFDWGYRENAENRMKDILPQAKGRLEGRIGMSTMILLSGF